MYWIKSVNFTTLVYSAQLFGSGREEVTEEWRKLHNEELVLLIQYCSGDQIEKNKMGGTCSTYGGV